MTPNTFFQNQILQQFLGEEPRLLDAVSVFENSIIAAQYCTIQLSENPYKEEIGGLFSFAETDEITRLCLLYFLPNQALGEAVVKSFIFHSGFFQLFASEMKNEHPDFLLQEYNSSEFIICQHSHLLLQQLQQIADINSLLQSLHTTEIALQLLRRAIEHISIPFTVCPVPACRFLAYDSEREKIMEARRILEQSFDQLITIKELSRKVAMNECYLKKGFKTLTGKTINEFQQQLRIGKAKELLQQQGQTVSEVANTLGYSSISHFSTAFKKATGIKPCELLV